MPSGRTGVVAEMRVAVEHAVTVEGHVPGVEHLQRDLVALRRRRLPEVEQGGAVEPAHGEQPPGRERGVHLRHVNAGLALQHLVIEGHVAGLALIVELFAQPRRDLGVDLAGVDRPVVAGIDGEDQLELADVGRHRRGHVGILQLAGERRAVVAGGAMHLAEGGGGHGLGLECGEGRAPVGAELGRHAALDECPSPWPAPATGGRRARRHIRRAGRRGPLRAAGPPSSAAP